MSIPLTTPHAPTFLLGLLSWGEGVMDRAGELEAFSQLMGFHPYTGCGISGYIPSPFPGPVTVLAGFCDFGTPHSCMLHAQC